MSIIIINVTFWMSFRTLIYAQITMILTLISWVGFGYVYGFGYCFLTDWHWQVKEMLGESNLPASYVKLVIDRTFGVDSDATLIDQCTIGILIFSLAGCLIQSIRLKNSHERIHRKNTSDS